MHNKKKVEQILHLVIFVLLSVSKTVIGQCETTDDSPDRNMPCIFPFRLNGKLRNSCTKEDDFEGRYWCATRTDNNLDIVDENWGYCPKSCPFEGRGGPKQPQRPKPITTTTRRPTRRTTSRPKTTQAPTTPVKISIFRF